MLSYCGCDFERCWCFRRCRNIEATQFIRRITTIRQDEAKQYKMSIRASIAISFFLWLPYGGTQNSSERVLRVTRHAW